MYKKFMEFTASVAEGIHEYWTIVDILSTLSRSYMLIYDRDSFTAVTTKVFMETLIMKYANIHLVFREHVCSIETEQIY